VLQNLSVVTNNTGDYKESIANCSKALEIDPKSAKAYYLRSLAHLKTTMFDEALSDCKESIKLNPKDKNLRTHFDTIKKEKAKIGHS